MPARDDIDNQQELLATYRRTLAHEVGRAGKHGGEGSAPVGIANGIYEARSNIRRIKVWLRSHGVQVEDQLNDDPDGGASDDAALTTLALLPTDAIPPPAPLPMPYRMPHRHNPQFVGRDDDMKRLAALLKAQQTIAIVAATGIGGVGKTQLASEFVHRYAQFFQGGVFWIDCSSEAAMRADIAACGEAGALDLPGFDALPDLDTQVARVRTEWQRAVPRLLVFDNLEDPKLLDLAPTSGGCRVLLTARRTTWSKQSGVTTHALDVLARADSLRLLLDLRSDQQPPTGNTDADAICEALGDLPLPLTLAGAFLQVAASVTLQSYLRAITQASVNHPSLNEELDEQLPTKHIPSIIETFRLSYDQLDDAKPTDALARTLLARAAQCAPAPIPRRLLVRAAALDPDDEASSVRADRALNRLTSLGMISILQPPDDATPPPLRLHRLLSAYARSRATSEAENVLAVERALIDEMFAANKSGAPQQWQPYLEHALHCAPAAAARGDETAATLLNNLGALLQAQGDLQGARPYYEQALAINRQVLGDAHPDTASSLNNLGLLLQMQGYLQEARPYYEQALAIHQQLLGEVHPDTARNLNNLGLLIQMQGYLQEARPYYEQALAIHQQLLGEVHPDTAGSLNNLGGLLQAQGNHSGARLYYEQALAINKEVLGEAHPNTATSLNNLGHLLQTQGKLQEAHVYLVQALIIRRQVLGEIHPDTATSLNNLGMSLQAQGNYTGARPYLEQALAIHRHLLGEIHPDTAQSLNNLGVLLFGQGDLDGARPYLEQALAIRKRILSETHPDIAQSLNNLGVLLREQGDLDGARVCYEQALAIRREALGDVHPDTVTSLNNLGYLAYSQGELHEARVYYEQALAICKQVLGEAHSYTAAILNNLALLVYDQEGILEAEQLMRQALAICEQALGPNHLDTQRSRESLAVIEARLRDDAPQSVAEQIARTLEEAEAAVAAALASSVEQRTALIEKLEQVARHAADGETERSPYLALAARLRELAAQVRAVDV